MEYFYYFNRRNSRYCMQYTFRQWKTFLQGVYIFPLLDSNLLPRSGLLLCPPPLDGNRCCHVWQRSTAAVRRAHHPPRRPASQSQSRRREGEVFLSWFLLHCNPFTHFARGRLVCSCFTPDGVPVFRVAVVSFRHVPWSLSLSSICGCCCSYRCLYFCVCRSVSVWCYRGDSTPVVFFHFTVMNMDCRSLPKQTMLFISIT